VLHSAEDNDVWLSGWTVRRPFLTVGCTALAVILPALKLPLWAVVAGALFPLVTLFFRRCRRTLWCLMVGAAALVLLCTAVFRLVRVEPLARLSGRTDTITGQVVALPSGGRMATVEVERADLIPPGTRVAMYFPEALTPALWDTFTVSAELNGTAFSTYQPSRGIFLSAFPLGLDPLDPPFTGVGARSFGAALNDRLYRILCQSLPEEESGVLAALCLGRREGVSAAVDAAFRGSGLSHLLVVSGLHLSLVVLALRAGLRRVTGLSLSALLTIPVMALFMVLVGASPSVMRAGLMSLCWLIGVPLRRRSDGLNALGLALTVLLLINPYQIYHVGFQLSFLATAGVLCLTPRLCGWLYRRPLAEHPMGRLWQRTVGYVWCAVAVCLSATLFTLPVAVYHFGTFSVSYLPANLLAVVPAGWVLLLGWMGLLLCAVPFLAWLGQPLLALAGYGTRYLTGVARWCSPPWAQISVTALWQFLLLAAVCLLVIYAVFRRLSPKRVLPPLLTLLLLAVWVGQSFTQPAIRLTVQPVTDGAAVVVEQGEKTALLVTHSSGLTEATALLQEVACHHLDYLVIGEGAVSDTGALTSLCRQAGSPQVIACADTAWCMGAPDPVTRISSEQPVSLWQGCTLMAPSNAWWRLNLGAETVQIGTVPGASCPHPGGLMIYTGLPKQVHTPSVVTCAQRELAQGVPAYADKTLLLTEDYVTFTVQPDGEWSVLPWR